MAKLLTVLAAFLLLAAYTVSAQSPPAWACAKVKDYYAKESNVCTDKTCSAAQRNIGGEVLVLDTDSYGDTNCQGCNLANPASCCQRCKDTDGCNAWVVCTNPGGCGSGCKAYLAGFKTPYTSDNGGKTFGNFKSCNGDKWPANMCSLKMIKDTKNPQILGTNTKDGWVSGIVPKVQYNAACPLGLAEKTCKMCLATAKPVKCIECVQKYKGDTKCAQCANLVNAATQDVCMKCIAQKDNYGCSSCINADCGFKDDCINTAPEKKQNAAAMDACFSCMINSAKAAGATGDKVSSMALTDPKAGKCYNCWVDSSVPVDKKAACIKCVQSAADSSAEYKCYNP